MRFFHFAIHSSGVSSRYRYVSHQRRAIRRVTFLIWCGFTRTPKIRRIRTHGAGRWECSTWRDWSLHKHSSCRIYCFASFSLKCSSEEERIVFGYPSRWSFREDPRGSSKEHLPTVSSARALIVRIDISFILLVSFFSQVLHLQGRQRSFSRGVLPVRHLRRVHSGMAGAAVRSRFIFAQLHGAAVVSRRYLHLHLRLYIQWVITSQRHILNFLIFDQQALS